MYDPVDQNHYLKVFFLLFLNRMDIVSIENLQNQNQDVQLITSMRKELFVSLYMLFKIDFIAEKYLPITEDIFDCDSVLVIRSLVQIWHQEEAKKKRSVVTTANQFASNVVGQVNKILV